MNDTSLPSLVKVTEIFLVPSSFLVAALGTADTNGHRAIVSLIGLIVSIFWWVCSREALADTVPTTTRQPNRTLLLSWLAIVFVVGWLVSLIAHLILWGRPLGS
jgi:hypothetical protein